MSKSEKSKMKSAVSLPSVKSSTRSTKFKDQPSVSLDTLLLKIISLQLTDPDPPYHALKVSFCDQLLVSAIVKPLGLREKDHRDSYLTRGTFLYDPSDYETMATYANRPLVVHIQPLQTNMAWSNHHMNTPTLASPTSQSTQSKMHGFPSSPHVHKTMAKDMSSCSVDILPLFIDTEKLCIRKRMEPTVKPKPTQLQSWDNLPLLTMSITAVRNSDNAHHHKILRSANWLKMTAIGIYNMSEPFTDQLSYITATKIPIPIPISVDQQYEIALYTQARKKSNRFDSTNFYPKWERLRATFEPMDKCDDKLQFDIEDVLNPDDLDLSQINYIRNRAIWGSLHRTLIMGNSERWFLKQQKKWKWPFECHMYGDPNGTRSYMAFADLSQLLYPGVNKVTIAVPLEFFSESRMREKANCHSFTLPVEYSIAPVPPPTAITGKSKAAHQPPPPPPVSAYHLLDSSTGANNMPAFLLIQVHLHHPLIAEVFPPLISRPEMLGMLTAMEATKKKQTCQGRGFLVREWKTCVKTAANSLRQVPYQGLTDLCNINRQLSGTRTCIELLTSFWMEAAQYINNNFVVSEFVTSAEKYKELLIIAHLTLMKVTNDTLIGIEDWYALDATLRAARHARQLNDIPHAVELYLQAAIQNPYEGDTWRELSTCLKDVDIEFAEVCLNKALLLDSRNPITILAKGCMVFEENPEEAEPFFDAILCFYPFWQAGNMIAYAYYTSREYYRMADAIKTAYDTMMRTKKHPDLQLQFGWERELGDFWEATPLLPGMSEFYGAADLLLRLRAIRMAEACLALSMTESGETAAYCHLVALCYRLRGDTENALCFVRKALKQFGENAYLRCLEAECLHRAEEVDAAMESFKKCTSAMGPYSVLLSLPSLAPVRVRPVLVNLVKRQPSAYAWMALGNDWLLHADALSETEAQSSEKLQSALTCAEACAGQALAIDRRAGRAWALLAKIVRPSKRRAFCAQMAVKTGFLGDEDELDQSSSRKRETYCHRFGVQLRECRCKLCVLLSF